MHNMSAEKRRKWLEELDYQDWVKLIIKHRPKDDDGNINQNVAMLKENEIPILKPVKEKRHQIRSQKGRSATYTKEQKLKYKLTFFKTRGKNTDNFTMEDFLLKFQNPICYLTGVKLDVFDFSTYHLDHIIPVACGGSSNLDNLGLLCPRANVMKGDIPLDEFISFCKTIIHHISSSSN